MQDFVHQQYVKDFWAYIYIFIYHIYVSVYVLIVQLYMLLRFLLLIESMNLCISLSLQEFCDGVFCLFKHVFLLINCPYLSIPVSIYQSIIHLQGLSVHLLICPSIHLFIYHLASICPSIIICELIIMYPCVQLLSLYYPLIGPWKCEASPCTTAVVASYARSLLMRFT